MRLCNRIRRDRQMHAKSQPRAYFTHDRFFDQQSERATEGSERDGFFNQFEALELGRLELSGCDD